MMSATGQGMVSAARAEEGKEEVRDLQREHTHSPHLKVLTLRAQVQMGI